MRCLLHGPRGNRKGAPVSKRFGRNQRRKLRAQVEQANRTTQYWVEQALMARAAEALYRRQLRDAAGRFKQELERQCSIGAGTFVIDDETGLWEVNISLDANTMAKVLNGGH